MEFEHSPKVRDLYEQITHFMDEHVYPAEVTYYQQVNENNWATPPVIAVLDWELSTLGHPFADLAYYCMVHRLPRDNGVRGLFGLDLDALGIPSEDNIISMYCRLRNIDGIDHWR